MIRFDGRVAIVTGAGAGLGRAHALALAERGAKVVVCDVGAAATDGAGRSSQAAEAVAAEIAAQGGEALAQPVDVTSDDEVAAMVEATLARWGRIDILVNNAGILLDRTFHKMSAAEFDRVLDVHLGGTVRCTRACWPLFREAGYGRVVFTTSASGLYGNFGQANYAAAKAAMLGLMNVLHLEGARHDIRVNMLAPTAATRMTESLLPAEALPLLAPEKISPGLLYLVSEDAPSRAILAAGAGAYALTRVLETEGIVLTGADNTPEAVAERWGEIADLTGAHELTDAFSQTARFARKAAEAAGLTLEWGG